MFLSAAATDVIKVLIPGESLRPASVPALPRLLSPPSTSVLDVEIVLGAVPAHAQLVQLFVY